VPYEVRIIDADRISLRTIIKDNEAHCGKEERSRF